MKSFKNFMSESANDHLAVLNKALSVAHYIKFPKMAGQYRDAIELFKQAIKDGIIYNGEYTDAYSYGFSRGLEKAYDGFYDDYREKANAAMNGDTSDIWGLNIQSIGKMTKIYTKHKSEMPEGYAFMQAVEQIPNTIKFLKTIIAKGRKPKEPAPGFVPKPMASMNARKKAIEFLQDAVSSFKKEYEASVTKSVRNSLEKVKGLVGDRDALKALTGTDQAVASTVLMRKGSDISIRDDYEHKTAQLIKDTIDTVIGEFVEKNTRKLSLIFQKKGSITQHKILKNRIEQLSLENRMFFEFDDGSSFTIDSQIVYKYTQTGKLFTQFPTRFTNVKMGDGTKMSMPSEEKMNKEF